MSSYYFIVVHSMVYPSLVLPTDVHVGVQILPCTVIILIKVIMHTLHHTSAGLYGCIYVCHMYDIMVKSANMNGDTSILRTILYIPKILGPNKTHDYRYPYNSEYLH